MFFEKKRAFFKKNRHILCKNGKYSGKCSGYGGPERVDEGRNCECVIKKEKGKTKYNAQFAIKDAVAFCIMLRIS